MKTLFLLLSFPIFAVTSLNEVREELQSVRTLTDPKQINSRLIELSDKLNEYSLIRKKQCEGEYSSLVINENGEEEFKKNKLGKKEKKICLLELVEFKKEVLSLIFEKKKGMILGLHKLQLNELQKAKEDSLKLLNKKIKELKD